MLRIFGLILLVPSTIYAEQVSSKSPSRQEIVKLDYDSAWHCVYAGSLYSVGTILKTNDVLMKCGYSSSISHNSQPGAVWATWDEYRKDFTYNRIP